MTVAQSNGVPQGVHTTFETAAGAMVDAGAAVDSGVAVDAVAVDAGAVDAGAVDAGTGAALVALVAFFLPVFFAAAPEFPGTTPVTAKMATATKPTVLNRVRRNIVDLLLAKLALNRSVPQ